MAVHDHFDRYYAEKLWELIPAALSRTGRPC